MYQSGREGQSKDEKSGHPEDGDRNERMRRRLYLESTCDWMMGSKGLRWGERLLTCMLLIWALGVWYLGLGPRREGSRHGRQGWARDDNHVRHTLNDPAADSLAGLIWDSLLCLPLKPLAFQRSKVLQLDDTKAMGTLGGGAEEKKTGLSHRLPVATSRQNVLRVPEVQRVCAGAMHASTTVAASMLEGPVPESGRETESEGEVG
ncbi:hypothetical protein CSAL01_05689 [Colletotrichum salicis]|uniref:Uncharacterized protein n=1 Tax=Colletotrichum salicis TaxID=1209931 RepID=A0A135TSD1_9PEZI|nr:hypothetical protein CSAL01_05689 [Colletotrichum salicis]